MGKLDCQTRDIRRISFGECVITTRKRSLQRLCFYMCLCAHKREYLGRYIPGQVHHSPVGTPRAGTPWQVQHPRPVTPPACTPPGRSPREHCMLGDTGNKRVVRILLEYILVVFEFDGKLQEMEKGSKRSSQA